MENTKVIEYNGRRYRASKTNPKYLYTDITKNGKRCKVGLHQQTYIDNYGPIPEGHDIHHIDTNTFNNDPTNLQAIEKSLHRSVHAIERWKDNDYREVQTANLDKARDKASKWHKSDEGRKWHSEMAKDVWKTKELTKKICEFCGKEFETAFPTRTKMCSHNCNQNKRYAEKKDFEKRECVICTAAFEVRKNQKTRTCSRDCSIKLRQSNKRLHSNS